MITYNPDFLESKPIFTSQELEHLNTLQEKMPLEYFMQSKTLNAKLGFDFIYSSAQIEGNTYTKEKHSLCLKWVSQLEEKDILMP